MKWYNVGHYNLPIFYLSPLERPIHTLFGESVIGLLYGFVLLYGETNIINHNDIFVNPSYMDHSLGGGLLKVGENNLVVSRMCEWNEHPETNK
jgi:hypothetical protein